MKEWIESHFREHYELLKELCVIPAPSHKEERRVDRLLEILREMGYEAHSDEAKNVLVPLFDAGETDITVYAAHIDVVFPDETPLPLYEEGGKLFCPGCGDNTANAAAILTILRYVKEKGLKPKDPLLFAFDSCEEGLGNLKGVRAIMSAYSGRIKEFVSFDCMLDEMITGAIGSERWRVTAKTRGGHSWGSFGSPNAVHRMAELVTKLYAQELPRLEGVRTTYNVGGFTGGTSINTIAQEAEILYEYRSDSRLGLSAMRESFDKLVAEADCGEARFKAELLGERPCGGDVDLEAHEKLIERCTEAIRFAVGKEPMKLAASTDANIPLSLGVPAVTFGLLMGGGAHTREEWLDIESLKDGLTAGLRLVIGSHFAEG